jgi:hypothetical protein
MGRRETTPGGGRTHFLVSTVREGSTGVANWDVDEHLFEVHVERESWPVRLRANVTDEPYRAHTPGREFVPLSVLSGVRTRVIARFYSRGANPFSPGARREQRIGDAEAYFYQEDGILLIWRCRLIDRYRLDDPSSDHNLHALWVTFEGFLHRRFMPTSVITPGWNLPYPSDRWREFLHDHDFSQPSPCEIPGKAFIRC